MWHKSAARKSWQQTDKVLTGLLVVLMVSVALLVFVQVILRYILHRPLMGIEEMLLFPAIWLYLLGGATASQERSHIRAPVVEVFLQRRKSAYYLKIVIATITVGVCAWLTYSAYGYFIYSIQAGKLSSQLYWPLVAAESAVFFGFVLMTIFSLVELADHVLKARKGL